MCGAGGNIARGVLLTLLLALAVVILDRLDAVGELTLFVLAAAVLIPLSWLIGEATDNLARRGLAVRAPDPADRRRNVITITPAGVTQLRRLEELLAGVQDELTAPLSPAERQELIRLLTQILDHHA